MLGGGLGQAALLMAAKPISRLTGERRAVEAVVRGLAAYARARGVVALPNVAAAAARARDLLRESARYGIGPDLHKLWSELELADALRGNLAGLGRAGLSDEGWDALARWLDEAAEAVRRGRRLDRTLPSLKADGETAIWLARFGRAVAAEDSGSLPTALPVPRASLRALLGISAFRRAAGGHAMRYALAIGVSVAAYRLGRVDHGYWAPLAVAFCLRPDFAGTLTRGLGRVVGTLFGVALATALVASAHPSAGWLTGFALGATWLTFALQSASYAGYSGALSFLVVVAITLSGASATTVGLERVLATAVGSAVALGTAIVWPRWEARGARQALAVAFAAQAAYADSVASAGGAGAMASARLTARAARLEAERIVGAGEVEPRWSRGGSLHGSSAALGRLAENAATILAAHVRGVGPARVVDSDGGTGADRGGRPGDGGGPDGIVEQCDTEARLRSVLKPGRSRALPAAASGVRAGDPHRGGFRDLFVAACGGRAEHATGGRPQPGCGDDPERVERGAGGGPGIRPDGRRAVPERLCGEAARRFDDDRTNLKHAGERRLRPDADESGGGGTDGAGGFGADDRGASS